MVWLNNSGDDYPNIAWAVAYYPYPPEIKSASKNGSNVRLIWDFNQGTAGSPNYINARTYATRGWPHETNDLPPSPREIKQFRVWSSGDGTTWSPVAAVAYGNSGGAWTQSLWSSDIAQSSGTTKYYAITSVEYSGLESRTLSNVWKVTLDSSGNLSETTQSSPYPADPGGKSNFYTKVPDAPRLVNYTHKKSPATADGQYTIGWTAPANAALIRYYNIYAADGLVPSPIQQNRIASIPASSDYSGNGVFSYIDWLGATDGTTKYLVTAVDFQGNESLPPVSAPKNLQLMP